MTKKICVSGYYGFDNFGDETILKVLVENLKKADNSLEITVFSSNPLNTASKYNVKSARMFCAKDIIYNLVLCDCLISGGGSLLQDVTGIKSLIYYLLIIASALIFGKKTIIFAHGIGPVNNKILLFLTVFLLKRCSFVSVRDDNSFNFLKSGKVKSIKCSDPVWNINVKKKENTGKIGIQLRKFPALNDKFINQLALCINKYYKNKEINILSLQNNIDLEVCIKLKALLTKINPCLNVKITENTSDEKVIEDICSLEELIAMRYHACLIAIKAGIKLLPLSYDIKVETLAKEFDLNYVNMSEDTSLPEIFEKFAGENIKYDKEKIDNLCFDFSLIKKIL